MVTSRDTIVMSAGAADKGLEKKATAVQFMTMGSTTDYRTLKAYDAARTERFRVARVFRLPFIR